MAKAIFGEFAAFHTQGGIRFQKENKLISKNSVPPEVVSYLEKSLGVDQAVIETPRPTPEETARLKAESLQVPPELERSDAEMEAAREHLAPTDFDIPTEPAVPIEVSSGTPDVSTLEPEAVSSPVRPNIVPDPDFLESVSIHTASLADMAEALYNRFGLYTVHLGRLPVGDEVNPLTGEVFTKYHLGIAYQAAIRAQNQGILTRPAELNRRAMDEGRAASENLQVDRPPQTMGEARRANSFDYRTSVRATQDNPTTVIEHVIQEDGSVKMVQRQLSQEELSKNGAHSVRHPDEDEPLVQPGIGKQVINPHWAD